MLKNMNFPQKLSLQFFVATLGGSKTVKNTSNPTYCTLAYAEYYSDPCLWIRIDSIFTEKVIVSKNDCTDLGSVSTAKIFDNNW